MDWANLGLTILSYLLPVAALVLTTLLSWGMTYLGRRYKVQLDLTQDAALRVAVRAAIGGAEEWGARKLKIQGKRVPSAEKAAWVKKAVTSQWPKLLPEDLDRLLDEEIAAMHGVGATVGAVGAVGSRGDQAEAAPVDPESATADSAAGGS